MNYTNQLSLQISSSKNQEVIADKYLNLLNRTKKQLRLIYKTSIITISLFAAFVIFIALFANSNSICPTEPYKALAGFGVFAFPLLFVYVGFFVYNLFNIVAILRNFVQLQNTLQNFFNHEQPKKIFHEFTWQYTVLLFFFPILASLNLLRILNDKEENQLNQMEMILGYELLMVDLENSKTNDPANADTTLSSTDESDEEETADEEE
ncbi:hypothetical protein OF376_00670 [Ureaplasma miroungigenitalium]|uniref:Uncharacterized protein n=1 Tax=Ureaplasma miroungigenitalium TaxID=1042321 RepID=A0ABT3BMJ2_9BACT|nr:hypothetical protein [Ureaplasma miroungigenitalium]MCV3728301.1 hypothetical protein [Ureaplasma miroungigenitalium]